MTRKLGATGEFPLGRLNRHDEGTLSFAIGHDLKKRTVIVDFGTPTPCAKRLLPGNRCGPLWTLAGPVRRLRSPARTNTLCALSSFRHYLRIRTLPVPSLLPHGRAVLVAVRIISACDRVGRLPLHAE
jgi:hypothetical protein